MGIAQASPDINSDSKHYKLIFYYIQIHYLFFKQIYRGRYGSFSTCRLLVPRTSRLNLASAPDLMTYLQRRNPRSFQPSDG